MSLLDTLTRTFFPGKETGGGRQTGKRGEDLRMVVRVPQRMRTGFVWNEKLITARPCMFKDMSVRGARVEIFGDPIKRSLLAEGVLVYFDTEKHEVLCSVAWSKGQTLGLRFEGRPHPPSRKYGR
ncbi:hypothetical protein [Hyphomicrobium sp.]|uniref:hypothetical protein n=1 Tax=Hyphomicrobium sp. TaxID=82 RepID=UPI003F6E954A